MVTFLGSLEAIPLIVDKIDAIGVQMTTISVFAKMRLGIFSIFVLAIFTAAIASACLQVSGLRLTPHT